MWRFIPLLLSTRKLWRQVLLTVTTCIDEVSTLFRSTDTSVSSSSQDTCQTCQAIIRALLANAGFWDYRGEIGILGLHSIWIWDLQKLGLIFGLWYFTLSQFGITAQFENGIRGLHPIWNRDFGITPRLKFGFRDYRTSTNRALLFRIRSLNSTVQIAEPRPPAPHTILLLFMNGQWHVIRI